MKDMAKVCPLPEHPPVQTSHAWKLGVDLDFLKDLKNKFTNELNWTELETKLNEFDKYIASLEEPDPHFIHAKSDRSDVVLFSSFMGGQVSAITN